MRASLSQSLLRRQHSFSMFLFCPDIILALLSYFVLMIVKCFHGSQKSFQQEDLEWTSETRVMDPNTHFHSQNFSCKGRRTVVQVKGFVGWEQMASLHGQALVFPDAPAHPPHGKKCPRFPTDAFTERSAGDGVWVGNASMIRKLLPLCVRRGKDCPWAGISWPWIYLDNFKGRWDAWKLTWRAYDKSHLVRYKHILIFPFCSWLFLPLTPVPHSPGRADKSSQWFTPPSGFHRHPAWRLDPSPTHGHNEWITISLSGTSFTAKFTSLSKINLGKSHPLSPFLLSCFLFDISSKCFSKSFIFFFSFYSILFVDQNFTPIMV